MPATPDPASSPKARAVDDGATDDGATDDRPLTRLAERFRVPLGVLVGVAGIALAVVFATGTVGTDGGRGLVEHVALVALWLCVAAAGITWAAGAPRRVSNLCAVAGVVCYGVVWVAGL